MNHQIIEFELVFVSLTTLSSVFLRVTIVLMMMVMHCENASDPQHIKEKYQQKLSQNIWELYVIGPRDTRALRSFYAFSMLLRINQTFCIAYSLFPEMRSQLLPPISLCFHFFIVRPQLFYYTTGNESFFDASLLAYVECIAPFLRFFSHSQTTIEICSDLNQADLRIKVPEYQEIEGIASLANVVQSSHLSVDFTANKPLENVLLALRSSFVRYFIDLLLSLRLVEFRGDQVYACTEPAEIGSDLEGQDEANEAEDLYYSQQQQQQRQQPKEEEEEEEIGERRRYRRNVQPRKKQPNLQNRVVVENANDAQLAELASLESDSTMSSPLESESASASESESESESDLELETKSMESDLGVAEISNEFELERRVRRRGGNAQLNASDDAEYSYSSDSDGNNLDAQSLDSYSSSVDSESSDSAPHPAILAMNRKPRAVRVMEYVLDPHKHYEHTDFTVIVDYQNVAMSYGKNKKFICKGIELCIDYWEAKGFSVVGFVPRYVLQENGSKNPDPVKIPDDRKYLQRLLDDGHIFQCPPQDYDDSYAIEYLKRKPSVIVSNDLFRDHMQSCSQQEKEFIKAHLISYTWAGDDFMPNPQFDWDKMIRASYR